MYLFLQDDSQDSKPTLPNLNNVEACLDSLDHYSRYKVNFSYLFLIKILISKYNM